MMHALAQTLAAQQQQQTIEWSVAVFGYNEAAFLRRCLAALAVAGRGRVMDVTVLLNGTTDASPAIAMEGLRAAGLQGRVYLIPHADKSNAINQFLHAVRPPAETYVFVDAYAAVAPDALALLALALKEAPCANGAAAVPSTGRSAARLRQDMQRYGGLHGSLFALRGQFVDRLAEQGLRLPLGMYRGDGLIGSLVFHDLDALGGKWQRERVVVEPRATWTGPTLRPWRWRDARRLWRRLLQQGRGRLQWLAVRAAIYDGTLPPPAAGFAALPPLADQRVLEWLAQEPKGRTPRWWKDPFAALALRQMRQAPPPPDNSSLTAYLLMETA